jgi:hypothetical protein
MISRSEGATQVGHLHVEELERSGGFRPQGSEGMKRTPDEALTRQARSAQPSWCAHVAETGGADTSPAIGWDRRD